MKRFTETNKWSDPWFRKLSSTAKLLWIYMCDHADLVGLVELDLELTTQDLRAKVTAGHLDELSSRLQHIGGSKYFLTKFIQFQYGELSERCVPHRKILAEIERHGINRVAEGYAYPSQYPTSDNNNPPSRVGTTLKTGRGLEEEKEKEEGGVGETNPPLPPKLDTPAFKSKWAQWKSIRTTGFRKPKAGWASLFSEQLEFLNRYDEPAAIEILSASIRNGWQGLFPPRQQVGSAPVEETHSEPTISLHGQTYTTKQGPQRHEFKSQEVFDECLKAWKKWVKEGCPTNG